MSQMFKSFSREWGFQHVTSSPTYPQSNGKAESAVKSMKKIIKGTWTGHQLDQRKLTQSLLQYRNTPSRRDGVSPSEKLFGKPIQDTLPAHPSAFSQSRLGYTNDSSSNLRYYNQHTCPLPEISVGTNVAIQNPSSKLWDIYGVVVQVGPYRQYHVKLTNGRTLIRNRRFI